eukprot:TRINITY_DN16105_c0_g2_i1.p1 TRINITY_DN16105_c0_g2~~TRINITY_DN16105_c0_g2_i1.p1  ORF type:complete len:330 (-),score=77.62 TRINITY_DN16105_c0_g2_i1:192-1181(-)
MDIHPAEECFTVKLRLYLLWEPDFNSSKYAPFQKYIQKAAARGSYVGLSTQQSEEFVAAVPTPDVRFFNAIHVDKVEEVPSIRLYAGAHCAVMSDQLFVLTCRQHYPLQSFPFDLQDLVIELRQDNNRSWDKFDLRVCCVQFHKSALQLAEWSLYEPVLDRTDHKATSIQLQLLRKPMHYLIDVLGFILALSVLGFVVFFLPEDQVAERVEVVLTLLLTAVAFKMVIGDTIPKVNYQTILDVFVLLNMFFLFVLAFVCAFASLKHKQQPEAAPMLSGCLWLGLNGYWVVRVLSTRPVPVTRPLEHVPNRTWYACMFAQLPFLPQHDNMY